MSRMFSCNAGLREACAGKLRVQHLVAAWLAFVGLIAIQVDAQTAQGARDADKGSQFFVNASAAQAATEKVFARMTNDFQIGGTTAVFNNLSVYSNAVPNSVDDPYWANYVFFNLQSGASNTLYVNGPQNQTYGQGNGVYAGLFTYQSTFQIFANARSVNDSAGLYSAGAQLGASFQYISLFEFAVFYSGLMEFSDSATLTINGRVHTNSNIYVGSPSALTFNSLVSTTGTITSPANAGYSTANWTGKVTYNGTPAPGHLTGQPALTLPLLPGNVQQILYPPTAAQSSNTIAELYYTRAHLVLMISNTTFTAIFQKSPKDPSPVTFTCQNLSLLTSNSWVTNQSIQNTSNWGTNWGWNWNWLSATNVLYDQRQQTYMMLAQIDVAKLNIWMNTWLTATWNTNINTKFSANNPFNVIYIADWRYTNNTTTNLSAIRLVNGTNLPTSGLTVATPNPLYILGNYNTPGDSNLLSTNTTLCAPASIACDALTILSPAWTDLASHTPVGSTAASDTVNVAIIAGNVPSRGSGSTQFSGGVNNLPRLLEDWRTATLQLNTSLVCLYPSTWATAQFVLPGAYYFAPTTRNFSFDQNLLSATKQPPGTPVFVLPPVRVSQSYSYPPFTH